MPDSIESKIRFLRTMLKREERNSAHFPYLDKTLTENESYVRIQITSIEDNLRTVTKIDREIVSMSEDDNETFLAYDKDCIFEKLKDLFFIQAMKYNDLLKVLNTTLDPSQVSANSTQTIQHHTDPFNYYGIKLPTMTIDPFEGNLTKWHAFKDKFERAIHNNPNLCNSTKVEYLDSLLKGEAKRVIKRGSLQLKPENYESLWKMLTRRYEHKRSLANAYFQELFNQESLLKETSKGLKDLHDTTYDVLSSLKNMKIDSDNWGDVLVFLLSSKLPQHTRVLWEEKIGDTDDLPKFETFMNFIETRFRTLEGIEATKTRSSEIIKKTASHKKTTLHTESNIQKNNPQKCKCCQKEAHYLFKCDKFKALNTESKIKFVKQNNFCLNCLGFHRLDSCSSSSRCQKCRKKHHTMLHLESKSNVAQVANNPTVNPELPPSNQGIPSTSDGRFSQQHSTLMTKSSSAVLFPTALVNVVNNNGFALKFRALVDACSDESYVSERVVKRLQLKTTSRSVETIGLGGMSTMSSESMTTITIKSLIQPEFSTTLKAYVLPKISSQRPLTLIDSKFIPKDINLADPNFNIPADIDMLLGGNIDALISLSGCLRYPDENIVLKQTKLGWIVSGGKAQSQCFTISSQEVNQSLSSLDQSIRRFWEIEEPPTKRLLTKEEKLAEDIYEATTQRLPSGKYVVSLPFEHKVEPFSNMRQIAMKRYCQIEHRLSKNESLYAEYSKCLNEYITMNHMSEINPDFYPDAYYIPHHCVIKESSTTTKLRVVFDASAKDSNLNSLNSNLLNGPRLQDDLLDLLIRFRTYRFAFTADIQQMYRQIWMNSNDRRFQVIVWRPSKESQIKTYTLNTVTFGTSSAPYLAVKTLTRLAKDERNTFPLGSKCLEDGFYVDDFIYGADSIDEALSIQSETKSILQTAGFNLRKWSANDQRLLDGIPIDDRETKSLLSFDEKEQSVKTLGIHWSPADDLFHFQINLQSHTELTKRKLLSEIAKIFDPLGWLSPCTIIAKLLIQKLWLKQQDWDEPISNEIKSEWLEFYDTLPCLQEIKLQRWMGTLRSSLHVELHGFADASEKAYAAVIYVRTVGHPTTTNLLFAKTKVAPLKKITLPRLELSAAYLLSKLMKHAKDVLKLPNISSHYWSDSTITLAWIKDSPHKRTTYVANRVSEIQTLSSPANWYHVKSQDNPADLGTRGILPSELKNNQLWWHGPQFLESFDTLSSPSKPLDEVSLPQEENKVEKPILRRKTKIFENFLTSRRVPIVETLANVMKLQAESNDLLNRFSTLSKLCRVVAYCKRWLKCNRQSHIHISPEEYDAALLTILRMVQAESFPQEIEQLQNNRPISRSSSILALSPMYHKDDNLLRINSRISNADHLTFDQKFPIILPRSHFISLLVARHAHNATLHGTQQQTLFLINQRYHIIRGSTLVRSVIHNCVRCFRFRCGIISQQMAPLPYNRITPIRAFLVCGVDLAGPFNLKKWKGRCNQFLKSYFAIFVCFSTKAVHLEVVVDLSSAEFIAAYRRFISRRGTPSDIHSDCGTNFVGAQGVITRKKIEHLEKWNAEMAQLMSDFHTTWHFNSPSSPHMGGLWEAGVKSAKHHLKRIIGNASLSYDEFETILVQIEACMNSRPLTQVTDTPDTLVLSPAHFLVQGPLNALPEPNHETDKMSCVDRWNYLQRLVQQFWKIWSQDYLNTLRERKKWRQTTRNIKINDVVLIKDSNLPPTVWPMGIVTDIHPGDDGLVRVVTVTSNNKSFQRPIVKLAPLPIIESN